MEDVKKESVSEDSQESIDSTEEEVVVEDTSTEPQIAPAGSKTDSALLLKSLQEERDRRRELEAKLEELSSMSSNDIYTDEGVALKKEIGILKTELDGVKSELTKKDILISHPILKDKWADFEEFRTNPDNKGMNLKTSAKAFLIENGLIDSVPRKGLEKATGGPKESQPVGYTVDDVKNLRETNFRKYSELLKDGKLKIQ